MPVYAGIHRVDSRFPPKVEAWRTSRRNDVCFFVILPPAIGCFDSFKKNAQSLSMTHNFLCVLVLLW